MTCSVWCPMKSGCEDIRTRTMRKFELEGAYTNAHLDEFREDTEKLRAFRTEFKDFCPIERVFKEKAAELVKKHGYSKEPPTTRYDLARDRE